MCASTRYHLRLCRQNCLRRTRYLASLRLVSASFNEIAQRELFRSIFVNSPQQLAGLSRFYALDRTGKHREVEECNVTWEEEDARKTGKRGGAKEWRKEIRRFCSLCPRLKKISIVGPERSVGAFFCADWLKGSEDTLEFLALSQLSIASYPEVSQIRFHRIRSLALADCRPYAASQVPSFYSHFPSLTSLDIDNENIEQSLVEGALTLDPPPLFLSNLRRLTLPQAPFLRLFAPPLHNRSNDGLSNPPHTLPPSLEFLMLTHVTFPSTLLPPFLEFVKKYAEFGGCNLKRLEVELEGECNQI